MISNILRIGASAIACLFASCATPKFMAFHKDGETVATINKPIYLMTVNLKNGLRSAYQPHAIVVNVETSSPKSRKDRLNFLIDGKAKSTSPNGGNRYLVRMAVDPGDKIVRGVSAQSITFPTRASCFAPIHADLKANTSGVYYLGHVEATIRERKGNEFRAGPSIPLIDQAVAGYSGGTFDVAIRDEFSKDEAEFRAKFPALKGVKIQKAIAAPFDREKAQQFWNERM